MVNGDLVIFNRQPSLHKMSMMVSRPAHLRQRPPPIGCPTRPTLPYSCLAQPVLA
jgi:hypothetical protein